MTLYQRVLGSLTGRLLVFSTLVAVLGCLLTVITLATSYQNAEKRAFRELLEAHLLAIVAQTVVDSGGSITAASDSGFPGFLQPSSGWYWQVNGVSDDEIFRSSSLAGADLGGIEPPERAQFDDEFERFWVGSQGPSGRPLGILETRIFLGDAEQPTAFRVTGPTELPEARSANFTFWLALSVGALALLLILANVIAVRLGLRPLARISEQIDDIRMGQADTIDERVPREVAPLVGSLNELIAGNKSLVERARAQVGNLAHALKTPIAVLQNESRAGDVPGQLAQEQTEAMKASVQRYLDRARIAAGGDGLGRTVDALPLVERLIRVMRKLNPEVSIELKSRGKTRFLGDAQDYEEALGNLLENAARHASSQVLVELHTHTTDFITTVSDDGRGLEPQEAQKAVQRGQRLDETQPGSGLGLAIVADIADAYGGTFLLERAPMGGLQARLSLPVSKLADRVAERPVSG
ncbi:MAG: ATP-binding protein [Pseudomonadota bacterium]